MKYKSMIYKENKEDTFGSSILEENIIWQEIFSSMNKAEEKGCIKLEELLDRGLQGILLQVELIT